MDFSEENVTDLSIAENASELPSSSPLSSIDDPGTRHGPFKNTYSLGTDDAAKSGVEHKGAMDDMNVGGMFNVLPSDDQDDSLELNLDDWLAEEPLLDFARGPDADEQIPNPIESDTATSSKEDGDEDDDGGGEEGRQTFKNYGLRPQARATRPDFWTTWMDQDDTGNYGERKTWKERQDEKLRRAKAMRRKRDHLTSVGDDEVKSEGSDELKPNLIPKLEVALRFVNEAGRRSFSTLAAKRSSQAVRKEAEQSDGYQFRRRSSGKLREREKNDDLTGHPSARGCHACLRLDIRCPLLDDESAWPCHTCTLDDEDCELIVPPTVKRACERCKSRRTGCSFSAGTEQGEACHECMETGHRCIAGPAKDFIRPRLRYEWNWNSDLLLRKKALKLLEAPSCSMVGTQQTKTIDKQVKETTSVDLSSVQPASESKPKEVSTGEVAITNTSSDSYAEFHKQHLAATKKIITKFCHPIKFNYVDKTGGERPCQFCAEPAFPFMGLPAKQVEVIEWKDGRGLEEVKGGHKSKGVDNTRVCVPCTLSRLSIVMCPKHQLMPLNEFRKFVDDGAALTELMSGTLKPGAKWCSICPTPAQYECCAVSEGSRCGLLLCEHDMVLLSCVYNGDLQSMLARIKDKPSEERVFGLRADCGFLKRDGLLMKFVMWSSQK